MNRFLQNRLVLQLLFTFVAALSLAALSVIFVTGAIRNADRVVIGEASKSLTAAINELRQQHQYCTAVDNSWSSLPSSAKDVSLQGITQTVLRAYAGVEGGFYLDSQFVGYAFPTHDTGSAKTDFPNAERPVIATAVQQSLQEDRLVTHVIRGRADLLVIEALVDRKRSTVTWAMKRLAGHSATGAGRHDLLLAILVLAALISIGGTLATGLSLARGVRQIKEGLSTLEKDFDFRLPERADELGGISRSVNQMAAVRKKLESELRREDRLRALGRLAAGLAHEIRNPLNSIRLTVQLLEHRLKTNSIRQEDLRTVQTEVDRLSSLLNDLLNLQQSRHPAVEMQPVWPVLQHCVDLVERQAEMQKTILHLESFDTKLEARFDSHQLTQAVVNLLLNALEAAPGGDIFVRASNADSGVRIEVQDSGAGLDASQQEHLFEPFYTTKSGGTGLGLAVSRELMRSQGGDLIHRPSKAGAIFTVELPVH